MLQLCAPAASGPLIRVTVVGYAPRIQQAELLDDDELSVSRARFEFGARSEAAEYVGALLREAVGVLASGESRIEAIARRPGVLTKVAIRGGTPLIAGDGLARVRERLDGERIDVVAWHHSAPTYIASALGLGETAPTVLLPAISHARVLLGEIDLRGIAGWRGINVLLASALTGWRIRLDPIAATDAWRHLQSAMRARRAVRATVHDRIERGLRLEVLGLYATYSGAAEYASGDELAVRITRMDPDEGRIFVSDRLGDTGQLPLL